MSRAVYGASSWDCWPSDDAAADATAPNDTGDYANDNNEDNDADAAATDYAGDDANDEDEVEGVTL